jgi:hypothetical protein
MIRRHLYSSAHLKYLDPLSLHRSPQKSDLQDVLSYAFHLSVIQCANEKDRCYQYHDAHTVHIAWHITHKHTTVA